MEEITAMSSKSSELCFSKEDFMAPGFSVEKFVSEYRKLTSLETLKEDLCLFLKVLQTAMVELINKDYADFVNLSTNLVGLDKSIKNLSTPLMEVQSNITTIQETLNGVVNFLHKVLEERDCIHTKKILLHRVIHVLEGLENTERQNLLPLVGNSMEHAHIETIERVAMQLNDIQFHMSQSATVQIIKDKVPMKEHLSSTLLQHLEAAFTKSFNNDDEQSIYKVLRIYVSIDKVVKVETNFRIKVIRPQLQDIISEEIILTKGIEPMYSQLIDFIKQKCLSVIRITRGSRKDFQVLKGYDFMVRSIWPEIVLCLEYVAPSVFVPGNPKLFHKNYLASMQFLEQFEHLCVVQTSVQRLREHSSYTTFLKRWNLAVYFEIRLQEIGGILEIALLSPFEKQTNTAMYHLNASSSLMTAINQCWNSEVYLVPLHHKFWKLMLQLISRHYHWVKQFILMSKEQKDMIQLVMLVHDVELLSTALPKFYNEIACFDSASANVCDEILSNWGKKYMLLLPDITDQIVKSLTGNCCLQLKLISDIPRLYRKTNRDLPTKPSTYISMVFTPLNLFRSGSEQLVSAEWLDKWCNSIISNVTEQTLAMVADVITSVKKMEESLKRLKKARDKPQGSSGLSTISDDDKIRRQLQIDTEFFGQEIKRYGISLANHSSYNKLQEIVSSAISNS